MNIGIFLGYSPGTILAKEGLGRYLGNLVKNIQNANNSVTIACPQWLLDKLYDLFEDFNIDRNSVDLIVEKRIPAIWKLYNILHRKRKYKDNRRSKERIIRGADLLIDGFLSITSFMSLFLVGIVFLLLGIIAIPFLLVGTIFYCIGLLLKSMEGHGSHKIKIMMSQLSQTYERFSKSGLTIYMQIYNHFLEKVIERLVRKINRTDGIDIWYSPAIFWPSFNEIKAPRVINIPDLVTEEFALKWGEHKETQYGTKLCEKTIDGGEYFIVYSNYVKENVAVGKYGKAQECVATIPHGINDLSRYVTIDSDVVRKMGLTNEFTTAYCKTLMQSLLPCVRGINEYVQGYDLSDVDYIFFPSQARPHKNIYNLVRAYEYLLRKKYVRVKLFLTCNLDTIPEIKQYIIQHRLQYDILSFYDVPINGLAALYHQAKLVVNPTLYEGGFPFTFGEGMSVGCPSVMSRIPQVCEMADRFALDDILFDPYNIDDIIEKIEYGLSNREELIEREMKMFKWMQDVYSQEKIGALYVRIFENIVKKNSN